jgi:hypothetical protein
MRHRVFAGLVGLALALACGGGGGANPETAAGTEMVTETGLPADALAEAGTDSMTGTEAATGSETGTGAEVVTGPETATGEDVNEIKELALGTGAFGEPCQSGAECASGLCFASQAADGSEVRGCTMECASQAGCAETPAGAMACQWLDGGHAGCVMPTQQTAQECASSAQCAWPTACHPDLHQCEVGLQCTFDGDCAATEACEPLVKQCQARECASDYDCKNPTKRCRDHACVAPECQSDGDCTGGLVCHPSQKACVEAPPCNEEGKCEWYNQACVAGKCVPNLCAAPCVTAGHLCNPATGKCGAPCGAGQACPAGSLCVASAGACEQNLPPWAAARVLVGGVPQAAAGLAFGQPILLDAGGSLDPNTGDTLTFHWALNAAPPGSTYKPGQALFAGEVQPAFAVDVPGLYAVGLWVRDSQGASSAQDQVVINVQ